MSWALPDEHDAPHRWLRVHWPAVLVLLLGILASVAIWNMETADEERIAKEKFQANTDGLCKAIQSRMLAYEQILRGGVSLFATMGDVSREQWTTYVKGLDVQQNFPGIHGLGYAAYVQADKKAEFLAKIRAQALPDYAIRPPGERSEYGPVTYLEPRSERNLKALGFDMLAEPTRHEAMVNARDTGKMAISAKLKLAAEPNQSQAFGFLVYIPVFTNGLPTRSVEERRVALRGFVNSPFRIDDLMNGFLQRYSEHMRLQIYDGEVASPEHLMYDQHSGAAEKATPLTSASLNVKKVQMVFNNRAWTLVFTSPAGPVHQDNHIPNLILALGLTISLLIAALVYNASAKVHLIRASQQRYFRLANFDALTGLPNRAMFLNRLDLQLSSSRPERNILALLFIDIDDFKDVNDSLGHHVGDALLKEVAARLQACVKPTDTLARLGGDEFTVMLCELSHENDASTTAQSMLNTMAAPFVIQQSSLQISLSIGITLFPADARTSDELLKNADQAMYAAKGRGKNQFRYFSNEMQESVKTRLRIVEILRRATEHKDFSIVYQPVINLSTGRMHKAEALLRLNNRELGEIGPDKFIPIAEEAGLMNEIGNWVFHEAHSQVQQWRQRYDAHFQISVNVSPVQFKPPAHGQTTWLDLKASSPLTGEGLIVEITEGLLLDIDEHVTGRLIALRDKGIQVALDDFGTGYSSLSYLQKLDIDYIKIDKSFVGALHPDSDDVVLCAAIIAMAHKLGLKVIAEGVETHMQCDLLVQAGCDFAQGYYFARPQTAEQFEQLLQSHADGAAWPRLNDALR